jgi:cytochrome oxidase Cu insertion factor (SCO1/SenC/PrrC family)
MSPGSRVPASPPGPDDREETFALAGLLVLFAVTTAWWTLAFLPVDDAPRWLARTRYVCFGVAESGLPDGGGWIGLIAGPLGMLAMLLAGWWRGVRGVLARARHSAVLRATFAVMALGILAVVGGATVRVRQVMAGPPPEAGVTLPAATYPRLDRAAPRLDLIAHDGRTIALEELRGRPVLVTFAYAHCQTVCPVIVRRVLDAQARLGARGTAVTVLVVTLDPWRDTPARLPAIAEGWALPADALVLGGTVDAVEAALDAWQVPRTRDATSGEVAHPSLVYVVDAEGTIAYAANGEPDALIELVERL